MRLAQTVEKDPSAAFRSTVSLRRIPKYVSVRRFLACLASGAFLTGLKIEFFNTLCSPETEIMLRTLPSQRFAGSITNSLVPQDKTFRPMNSGQPSAISTTPPSVSKAER